MALPQGAIIKASSIAYRRRAFCQILVDGIDVTARFDPYLISAEVIDKYNDLDTCSIELDDRDGRLNIPPDQAPIKVRLGWAGSGPRPLTGGQTQTVDPNLGQDSELRWEGDGLEVVFEGVVQDCESGFARQGGGRRLWIDATGANIKGDGKSPKMGSWGEGVKDDANAGGVQGGIPFSQVFAEAAAKAGLQGIASPSLQILQRDHWWMNESFHHFGMRMAKELGGAFKIIGNTAIMVNRQDALSVDGSPLATIEAEWGINLIQWRIKPFAGRPQYRDVAARYFDIQQGQWLDTITKIPGITPFGGSTATAALPAPAPNKQVGGQTNDGMSIESQYRRGTGWCIINGEPLARALGQITLIGARPGVDGTYRINEAQHSYSRQGYTTRCTVENPNLKGNWKGWPGGAAT